MWELLFRLKVTTTDNYKNKGSGRETRLMENIRWPRPFELRAKLYWIKCGCNGFCDIISHNVYYHATVPETKTAIICEGDETGIQPKRKIRKALARAVLMLCLYVIIIDVASISRQRTAKTNSARLSLISTKNNLNMKNFGNFKQQRQSSEN